MTDAFGAIRNSPVDYRTAVGYALQLTMLGLLVTYVLGTGLLWAGLAMMSDFSGNDIVGLGLTIAGVTVAFGAAVGVVFKVIVDGVALANGLADEESP